MRLSRKWEEKEISGSAHKRRKEGNSPESKGSQLDHNAQLKMMSKKLRARTNESRMMATLNSMC